MKEFLKYFIFALGAAIVLGLVFWAVLRLEKFRGTKYDTPAPVNDSTAAAKEALKSPILAGKIAATIEHCKLYELETDKHFYLYWSICIDAKGNISTGVTAIPKYTQ